MEFDALTAGIEPGGLRSKNEIRILICYLLSSVNAPLSKDAILTIVQDNGLANYFEVTNALAELVENGNLIASGERQDIYTASDTAKMIANQLDTALPVTVRDRAVNAAINLLAQAKRERENKVEITKIDLGYQVTCHVSGGDMDLMNFSIYVPDSKQAKMVKHFFQKQPQQIYQMLLALVTGNHEIATDLLTGSK